MNHPQITLKYPAPLPTEARLESFKIEMNSELDRVGTKTAISSHDHLYSDNIYTLFTPVKLYNMLIYCAQLKEMALTGSALDNK